MKPQEIIEIDQKIQQLQKEQQKLLSLMESIRKVNPAISEIVKFNVGGKKFATAKQNLLSEPSFFTGLLSNCYQVETDEKGAIFLDRNPKYFGFILDYLRNNKLHLKQFNDAEKEEFLEEVYFYQIRSLIELLYSYQPTQESPSLLNQSSLPLQFDTRYLTRRLTLSNNNTTITVAEGYSWNCAILCNKQARRWRVAISSRQPLFHYGGLMIGVAAKNDFKKEGDNYRKTGYFINPNGTVFGMGNDCQSSFNTFGNGCTVEVWYEKNEISFGVNGPPYGATYTNVPNNLYPAFDFCYGCSLTITQLA